MCFCGRYEEVNYCISWECQKEKERLMPKTVMFTKDFLQILGYLETAFILLFRTWRMILVK